MMKRTLMIWMVMALAALPLMAAAQQPGEVTSTYGDPQSHSERRLIPKGAQPHTPSSEARPSEVWSDEKAVRDAQIALRDAGFDPGRIDGVMGPKTQTALSEFQASKGLPQTRMLDAATQQQLLAGRAPEPSSRPGVGFGR
jgi:peptidoglycan hydrolase-like protein with peptidoglycan-binding domain